MPAHVYVTMKGQKSGNIVGDSTVKGREGNIEIMQFDHSIRKPTDQFTGQPTGLRVHSPVVLWKAMDQASPILYQVLCTGETLTEVDIKFYETDPAGGEKQRFDIKLENAHVTEMKTFMPSTKDSGREHFAYHESVSLVYERITWEDKDFQKMATDDWTQRD
jgi:type VI secretion system secreted protein Hcp